MGKEVDSMRKAIVEVKAKLVINMDDDVKVSDVIGDMNYDFDAGILGADIIDTEIMDYEVTDSK